MMIALVGKAGSGKSLSAKYLCDNYDFTELTFSSALKNMAHILGFEHKQIYGTQSEKEEINSMWNVSGRTFLQKLGTEFGRQFINELFPEAKMGNNLWIRLLEKSINETKTNIVVSDCRFLNEAKMLREKGFLIVKIDRHTEHTNNHASETELDSIEYDYIIDNKTTIDNLYKQLDNLLAMPMYG